ncbi:hypothetical protein PoB_005647800 [Plakobranchus ocellatus]|uniref:Uncharacterized protein n=1 Tax=Plakobranchus ocellatus TaxID=259542 RepID=A0AAV4CER6_9GAST|nr:hypothetical protein PoB_005647800 [Plakobranchus ocellatus]
MPARTHRGKLAASVYTQVRFYGRRTWFTTAREHCMVRDTVSRQNCSIPSEDTAVEIRCKDASVQDRQARRHYSRFIQGFQNSAVCSHPLQLFFGL